MGCQLTEVELDYKQSVARNAEKQHTVTSNHNNNNNVNSIWCNAHASGAGRKAGGSDWGRIGGWAEKK